jgi:hypothetical protein
VVAVGLLELFNGEADKRPSDSNMYGVETISFSILPSLDLSLDLVLNGEVFSLSEAFGLEVGILEVQIRTVPSCEAEASMCRLDA